MLIGYARVSTQDQNLTLQRDALRKARCEKIYEDSLSAMRLERPGLTQALDALRAGDSLVVWKLDRLGRSVKSLIDLVGELSRRDIEFKSLTDSIDTGYAGRALLFPRHGQSGADGAGAHCGTHARRTPSGQKPRPYRWTETAHDREQDRRRQAFVGRRSLPQGGRTESRGIGAHALSLDSGVIRRPATS